MDDFVNRAFTEALDKYGEQNKLLEEFADISERMIDVFIRNVGPEKAQLFLDNVVSSAEYGDMVVMLSYIFFVAGRCSK